MKNKYIINIKKLFSLIILFCVVYSIIIQVNTYPTYKKDKIIYDFCILNTIIIPKSDPVPHDPVPHDPIPHDPVPHDPIPHDPIPHDPIPHDPIPHDPIPHVKVQHHLVQYSLFKNCQILKFQIL